MTSGVLRFIGARPWTGRLRGRSADVRRRWAVGGFTVFTRRRSETVQQTQGGELPEAVRQSLPMRFEAVEFG